MNLNDQNERLSDRVMGLNDEKKQLRAELKAYLEDNEDTVSKIAWLQQQVTNFQREYQEANERSITF